MICLVVGVDDVSTRRLKITSISVIREMVRQRTFSETVSVENTVKDFIFSQNKVILVLQQWPRFLKIVFRLRFLFIGLH